jgi:hypothetical protein
VKQALILFVIFLIAFAATYFLTTEVFRPAPISGPADVADGVSHDEDVAAKRRADINRSMLEPGSDTRAAPVVTENSEAPAVAEVEGEAKTNDGVVPRDLKVFVQPAASEPRLLGGGRFAIGGLAPGMYYIWASAEGYLAQVPAEVTVEAGKKYNLSPLWLEKGFELSGIVIEDTDQRPIQGALVDFNGLASAVSDARGQFRTGLVSPKALEVVTVTHDEYDRNTLIHAVMPETKGITLAMSRGKGTISGTVIPVIGEDPAQFRVRIWRLVMEGHEQLRREKTVRGQKSFEIRGVFDGQNALEVSFPGTTLASRRIEFDLNRQPALHFDVDLNNGGRIEGTFTTKSNLVSGRQVTLFDAGNHVMGETRTDADGKFRFDQVTEGSYSLRMDTGIPPVYTPSFKVEDRKVLTLTVDGQTGRLK